MSEETDYLSVSTLTSYLKRKFDYDPYLAKVYLTGEISNWRPRTGHQYFSLKDDHAVINATMFKNAVAKLQFVPEEGMKVNVIGHVSLYEASGRYQIIIEQMAPDGVGALYAAYEQLKKRLAQEGLFSQPKRALPRFPKKVAVITSPSGAVIQDIRTTVARRYPILQLTLFPAQVQGTQAAPSIIAQLKRIKADPTYDALIIGRGGGSIEDLWPFNEEAVARMLATMPMPVVSSVGHETDTTIVDFVADARAATPTAAAELVTPVPLLDAIARIQELRARLGSAAMQLIKQRQAQLTRFQSSVVLTQPARLYDQYLQQVDHLSMRLVQVQTQTQARYAARLAELTAHLQPQLVAARWQLAQSQVTSNEQRMVAAMNLQLHQRRQHLQQVAGSLDHLSPLKILGRGYAYTTDQSGQLLSSVKDFTAGQAVVLHVQDGQVPAVIQKGTDSNE